jgi:chromosome segregation ATPase
MDDLVKRLNDRLGGVKVPEAMHGDNLAIVLCSFYEDAEGEIDDNGWTEVATKNCEATLEAIRQHYAPLAARIAELEAERDRFRQLWHEACTRSGGNAARADRLSAMLKEADETVKECFDALRSNASPRERKNAWERASALLARLEAREVEG